MLRLVVGGTAPVIALALLLQGPWRQSGAPLFFQAPDHIAVTVGEHRRQTRILDALCDEDRADAFDGVGQDLDLETHRSERGRDLVAEVHVHVGPALGDLALGAYRDAAREV